MKLSITVCTLFKQFPQAFNLVNLTGLNKERENERKENPKIEKIISENHEENYNTLNQIPCVYQCRVENELHIL
jgi:hypothetical protein